MNDIVKNTCAVAIKDDNVVGYIEHNRYYDI